jgi:hypothetical protein
MLSPMALGLDHLNLLAIRFLPIAASVGFQFLAGCASLVAGAGLELVR